MLHKFVLFSSRDSIIFDDQSLVTHHSVMAVDQNIPGRDCRFAGNVEELGFGCFSAACFHYLGSLKTNKQTNKCEKTGTFLLNCR